MAKSAQKLQARALRRRGESLGEIAKIVGTSKGSISYWCRDIALTEKQIEALLARDVAGMKRGQLIAAENKRRERQFRVEKYQLEAFQDVGKLSRRDLFMLGIGLYWAEGSKRRGLLSLANTDSHLVKAFLMFIKHVYGNTNFETKYRIQLNIDHKNRYQEVLTYWSQQLHVPKCQFSKPTFIKAKHKKIFDHRKTYYGVIRVTIGKSTNLNYKVFGYINSVKYAM